MRRCAALQLCHKLRHNLQTMRRHCQLNAFPPRVRIGTELLSFDERDLRVSQLVQVLDRQRRRLVVVEDNVRHTLRLMVSRDRHRRHPRPVFQRRVNRD